jgi:hypothetical protein
LLIRVTVIGGLIWGMYDGVSKYKDFRESIELLVHDAEKYGSAIVNQVVELTGEKKKPDTVAKRDMTPGRINRVIQKLEKIRELEEQHAPTREVQERLRDVTRDVVAIERDLEPQELKANRPGAGIARVAAARKTSQALLRGATGDTAGWGRYGWRPSA